MCNGCRVRENRYPDLGAAAYVSNNDSNITYSIHLARTLSESQKLVSMEKYLDAPENSPEHDPLDAPWFLRKTEQGWIYERDERFPDNDQYGFYAIEVCDALTFGVAITWICRDSPDQGWN